LGQTNYGTGLVRITRVVFLDRQGRDVVEVCHGDPLTVRLTVRMEPELISRDVTFVLGFARHESPYSSYIYEPHVTLPPGDECTIDVRVVSILLGSGHWYVNAGIGEAGVLERETVTYFTVDAGWHHMLAARLELHVLSSTKVDTFGCFVVHPATVSVATAA